jgi:hypothetical protein
MQAKLYQMRGYQQTIGVQAINRRQQAQKLEAKFLSTCNADQMGHKSSSDHIKARTLKT